MPQTISEKIFSKKIGKKASAGEIVKVDIDTIMSHDSTTPLAIEAFEQMNAGKIHSEKMVFVFDHVFPASNVNAAELHKRISYFALKHKVKLFPGNGISHQILPEQGLIAPWDVVIGADSHSCTYGAFGAFGTGMGSTDIAVAWATGKNWFKVPETIRIKVSRKLKKGVFAKDLMLSIASSLKEKEVNYKALEFCGETIDGFSISERMTLSNMAVECNAKAGLIPADKKTIDFLNSRTNRPLKEIAADAGAEYFDSLTIDASLVEPLVSVPHQVSSIKPVSEVDVPHVDQVFIGSCTNGRLDDLRIAASVLKGKKVNPGTRLIVTPASQEIYLQAVKEGIIGNLISAGAVIGNSGCGPCLGRQQGALAENEICVSTMNRNFMGRMGAHSSKIYLVSPYTAAFTAIKGRLAWSD